MLPLMIADDISSVDIFADDMFIIICHFIIDYI